MATPEPLFFCAAVQDSQPISIGLVCIRLHRHAVHGTPTCLPGFTVALSLHILNYSFSLHLGDSSSDVYQSAFGKGRMVTASGDANRLCMCMLVSKIIPHLHLTLTARDCNAIFLCTSMCESQMASQRRCNCACIS